METRRRTLVKAVMWNLIGLLMMTGIGWSATGSASVGGALAAINTIVGFTTYLIYERFWARVRWGRAGF